MPRISKPICAVKPISKGNQPTDGGHLILSPEERESFLLKHPEASFLIKRLIGAREFLQGQKRYCLWLVNIPPNIIRSYPFVMDRVEKCRKFRAEEGVAGDTIALAATPTVFRETRNPASYVVLPSVSSERRNYIPFGFESSDTIATNLCLVIDDAGLFEFGCLSSIMHMAWVRAVCGRLESRYRYSAGIVYNNFPWLTLPVRGELVEPQQAVNASTGSARAVKNIEAAAQAVLDARAVHTNASLADLYDPLTMPANLLKAHQVLDKAVDAAYGYKGAATDAARVAFLFERYQQITSLLPAVKSKTKSKKPRN